MPTTTHLPTRVATMSRHLLVLVATALVCAGAASAAHAAGPIAAFDVSTTQSAPGSHGDLTIHFGLETDEQRNDTGDGFTYLQTRQMPKRVAVDLPPGYLADPTGASTCTERQVRTNTCPVDAQVGLLTIRQPSFVGWAPPDLEGNPRPYIDAPFPIFNLTRASDQAARFGIPFAGGSAVLNIEATVRDDSDYGVTATIDHLPSAVAFYDAKATFWGIPGHPVHDEDRAALEGGSVNPYTPQDKADGTPRCVLPVGGYYVPCAGRSVPAPHRPFMVAPTRCGPTGETRLRIGFYNRPGEVSTASASTGELGTTCGDLTFAPTLTATPASTVAGQPSAYTVTLAVPQNEEADRPATAHLRGASVTLPAGTSISPAAASGLGACTDEQLGIGTTRVPGCPDTSKIGSVTIESPVVDAPLKGAIHLGDQRSQDPQSGEMYRLLLVAEGSGVTVRLRGAVRADPRTGQLTASFEDNPQLPFDKLTLAFDGGSRAPLVNPTTCGTMTTRATMTSWAGHTATSDSTFVIDQGCTPGFAPGFTAGSTDQRAGAYAPFSLVLARADGDQELSTLDVTLPPGLVANLASVPLCGEAQAAAGTCGAGSRIGSVQAAAGAGAEPLWLPQQGRAPTSVALAGPYKGAPFSLSIVVPAQAGPFDLGTVVVRAALHVDPNDAHVTVKADPLPTIVRGVPLKLREVRVAIDRAGFMVNPTSCDPMKVAAAIGSTAGAAAAREVRYQASGCAALGYAPRLALALGGKGQTVDGKHPSLTARMATRPGDANTRQVQVTLPLSLALDPDNANALCEPSAAATNTCPAGSIVGRARARSILPDELSGPVYFVRGERRSASGRVIRTLPKLFVPLSANGVTVNLRADSEVVDDHLVTTFHTLPDVPITSFDLDIAGGKNGILVVSGQNVCAGTQVANGALSAQSGRAWSPMITMATPCPLAIVRSAHSSRALKLRVGGIGAGRVTASGKGLVAKSRTIRSSTVAAIDVPLRATTRRALARGRDVKVAVTVAFRPAGAEKTQRITKRLTIHGVKRKR